MCFSCRPSSTSSVFIRKYTSFFVRKCGRWTFWTCGMWSPIRLKKYVIHAFASATLVASVRLTPFLLNSVTPSRNWWSNFWYLFLEIPRADMNASRQISCPSSITAEFSERLFSPVTWMESRMNWFCSVVVLDWNFSLACSTWTMLKWAKHLLPQQLLPSIWLRDFDAEPEVKNAKISVSLVSTSEQELSNSGGRISVNRLHYTLIYFLDKFAVCVWTLITR